MLFCVVIFTQSCKKSDDDNNQQTINLGLKKNQYFKYAFGLIGIEDGMAITRQAKHFDTSKLERDSLGKMIYNYKPRLNYVGNDNVEITFYLSNGATVVNSSKTIIRFTITE